MKRYVITIVAFLLIIGALVGLWWTERQTNDEKESAEQGEAQAEKTALAYEDSLEALCEAGYEAACKQLVTLPDVPDEIDDPDPDNPEEQEPEIQEREVQEREIQDREPDDNEPDDREVQDDEVQDEEQQDGEVQDGEVDDPDPDDPENQDPEIDDPDPNDPDPNDPDPNDPPVCEGEFVCQGELEAAIANFVTMVQVVQMINEQLAPLGCEVTIVSNQGPPLVLDCNITGKG